MKGYFVLLFLIFLAGKISFSQGSAEQWKYSSSNPSGIRYADFAPKDRPLATPSSGSYYKHYENKSQTNNTPETPVTPAERKALDLNTEGGDLNSEQKYDEAYRKYSEIDVSTLSKGFADVIYKGKMVALYNLKRWAELTTVYEQNGSYDGTGIDDLGGATKAEEAKILYYAYIGYVQTGEDEKAERLYPVVYRFYPEVSNVSIEMKDYKRAGKNTDSIFNLFYRKTEPINISAIQHLDSSLDAGVIEAMPKNSALYLSAYKIFFDYLNGIGLTPETFFGHMQGNRSFESQKHLLIKLASAYFYQGEFDSCIAVLHKAMTIPEGDGYYGERGENAYLAFDIGCIYRSGFSALGRNDYQDSAIKYFNLALALHPVDIPKKKKGNESQYAPGSWLELKLNLNYEFYFMLGLSYFDLKKYAEAETYFLKGVQIRLVTHHAPPSGNPYDGSDYGVRLLLPTDETRDVACYYYLAYCKYYENDYKAAIDYYNKIGSLGGDKVGSGYILARKIDALPHQASPR